MAERSLDLVGLPWAIAAWLSDIVEAISSCLGPNLEGVYLHGSLAMGCFHAGTSDVDLLLGVGRSLRNEERDSLRDLLLARSGDPHPAELTVLTRADRFPWRHPMPFDLHYSELWRPAFAAEAAGGPRVVQPAGDGDLAAHVAMLLARGRRLRGEPIETAFLAVPRRDFLDAVFTSDAGEALAELRRTPVDGILNLCRLGLYARTGKLGSKREGAIFALAEPGLPELQTVARALAAYESGNESVGWDEPELRRFATEWTEAVARWLA